MKKTLLLSVLLLVFRASYSQTKDSLSAEEKARREKNIQAGNPFKKFGYKPKIATLSKGKYLEFHDLDTIVKIGSFSYHVKNKQITGYTRIDPNNSEAGLSPEVISRWLSPDPLAEEFPSWSPYTFTNNNPIRFTDPTGLAAEDIIDVEKSTGKISITKAEGDDIVRIVNNGNVENQYTYGENGSFSNDNKIIRPMLKDGKTKATVLVTNQTKKAENFYRFAAQSEVEFSKIDVTVNNVNVSVVSTGHKPGSEPTNRELVKEFSKRGFVGVKQSHSHPGNSAGAQVPSGYYGIEKGNPASLTVFDRNYGDAGNANRVRQYSGFENTIFEVFSPTNQTITTYDGINQAKVHKAN